MTVQASMSAEPQTVPAAYVAPQTVVALAPSYDDPALDRMRLRVNGVEITRSYDVTT